jgi:hypothetical protein
MRISRPIVFLATLLSAVGIASVLSVTTTKTSFSESYPVVVCPPTLAGLSSQISLSSKKTPFQRLQVRTTATAPVKVLRLPVNKDSLVINSEGIAPVVWQSKAGVWAGSAVCTASAASQWFVGGTADVTTRGRLIIVNSGLSDAIVDVQSFTENGKQPLRTINVASKNFIIISLDSLAPGDKSLTVQVAPRSGRVNAFMVDEQGKGLKAIGGDLVNFVGSASKDVYIPAIPNKSSQGAKPFTHILRVLTPGEVDASVSVEVLSTAGVFVPVGFTSRTVSPGIVTEFELNPSIASKVMGVRITASEPIFASVKSTVADSGKKDFVWSTAAPELIPLTMAITGLDPWLSFVGKEINVSVDVTLINGKVIQRKIKGSDIATWQVPTSARSISITKVGKATFAGALVSSVNGFGYFPVVAGSQLTKVEVPDSNIRVLNP